jgi:hypothetical protein
MVLAVDSLFEGPLRKKCKLLYGDLIEKCANLNQEKQYARPLTRIEEYRLESTMSELDIGHATMNRIRDNYATIKEHVVPSMHQDEYIQLVIESFIPVIYSKSWLTHERIIRRYNNMQAKIHTAFAVTAPRRFGKSYFIVILCILMLMSVPGVDLMIVAQSANAVGESTGLRGKIKAMLKLCFNYSKFKNNNSKHLVCLFPNNDERKVHFYSSKMGDNLRGGGTNFLILEEAAYIDRKTVSLLLPLMSEWKTRFIALSTNGELPSNVFNKIIKSPFVDAHIVSYVCGDCVELGVRDTCKHKADSVPTYATDTSDFVKSILGDENEDYARENLGIEILDQFKCFTKKSVDKLFTKQKAPLVEKVDFVFVTIDPCAGSGADDVPSDFAIITTCLPAMILGGEKLIVRNTTSEYKSILIEHLEWIRAKPECRTAILIVDCESGTGQSAGDIEEFLREKFRSLYFFNDFDGKKAGTWTSNGAKVQAMELFRVELELNTLRFYDQFVTHHTKIQTMMSEWQDQIVSFEKHIRVSEKKSINSLILSGKRAGKRDDMCLTLMRAIRNMYLFKTLDCYRELRCCTGR